MEILHQNPGLGLGIAPHHVPTTAGAAKQEVPLTILDERALEDIRIKALVETSALPPLDPSYLRSRAPNVWTRTGNNGFRARTSTIWQSKTPPAGYICRRCNEPDHFIQHCPTNGDPYFDIKRIRPPTGIPKTMLRSNPDGSYALPDGHVGVLQPDEAAFEKAIQGLPTITTPLSQFPPELLCPLCCKVMRDVVLPRTCCCRSFCDSCIRDHLITHSGECFCGAKDILADDLVPNLNVREYIARLQTSGSTSSDSPSGSRLSGSKRRSSERYAEPGELDINKHQMVADKHFSKRPRGLLQAGCYRAVGCV